MPTLCAHGVLPGPLQTVPRAELYGILMVLRAVDPCSDVCAASDSQLNVKQYHAGLAVAGTSVNSDLWFALWRAVVLRRHSGASAEVRWVKAHQTESSFCGSASDVVGNYAADALASRAAA